MWQPEQRLIFGYEFAGEVRWADPSRVRRLLLQFTAGKLAELCRQANQVLDAPVGTPEFVQSKAAYGVLAEAAFAAFQLQPLDPMTGQGATEDEVMVLLAQFLTWESEKKTPGGTTS